MYTIKINPDVELAHINEDQPSLLETLSEHLNELDQMHKGNFNAPPWFMEHPEGKKAQLKSVLLSMIDDIKLLGKINGINDL